MVLPVLGPFVSESFNDVEGTGSFWEKKESYTQSRPYNLPLNYTHWRLQNVKSVPPGNAGALGNAHAGHSPWFAFATRRDRGDIYVEYAIDKARQRFYDRLGSSAQLSTTFGEWKQADRMISNRARVLTDAFRYLRSGQPKNALGSLLLGDHTERALRFKSKYAPGKNIAGQWLELHFGWVPLIQDIWNSLETLQSPVPYGRIYGSAKRQYVEKPNRESPGQWFDGAVVRGETRVRIGAHVWVNNPNLYLLNRLGLVNPASLAWELTPWSFVYDWFANVNTFLEQFSSNVGLTVERPWYSISSHERIVYTYTIVGNPQIPYLVQETTADHFVRRPELPEVRLSFKPVKAPSVTRAATAIALLVQKLPSK